MKIHIEMRVIISVFIAEHFEFVTQSALDPLAPPYCDESLGILRGVIRLTFGVSIAGPNVTFISNDSPVIRIWTRILDTACLIPSFEEVRQVVVVNILMDSVIVS